MRKYKVSIVVDELDEEGNCRNCEQFQGSEEFADEKTAYALAGRLARTLDDTEPAKTIEEESKSLDDLAAEQGVKPVENIKSLENPELAEVMEEPGDGAKGWWKCEHCGRMTRSDALDCGLCPDCKASLRAKGRGW